MTGLIITGSVLLFFMILLLSPIRFIFSYQSQSQKLHASLCYLFIKIDFSPEEVAKRAEKKAEREVKKEYKKQKQEEGTKQKEKKAAADTAKTVWSLVKACKKGLDIIRRHLVFYKIKAGIVVGGDEAQKIALNYAAYCTLISNGLAVLGSLFVVKEPRIAVRPDFLLDKTDCVLAFRVRIAPWYILAAAFHIFVKFIKVILENKQKRKKIKGGKKYERKASCQ